jgi:xanthine/uracil permease
LVRVVAHTEESFSGQQGVALLPDGTHPVDEVLKPVPMLVYGLQHVMSMYAGVVAVPFIVGSALGLSFADLSYLLAATLLVSGLATLIQTLGVPWVGARLPIVQGTSFAAVASMLSVGKAWTGCGPSSARSWSPGCSGSCCPGCSPGCCGSSRRWSPGR